MSDIPVPSIRGNTDTERVTEMISYLSSLSSAIDRAFLSIDFSNLNEDLADRINKSITEHQDLTGYASKNYAKKNFTSFEFVDGVKVALEGYTDTKTQEVKDYVYNNYCTYGELQAVKSELESKIEKLEERIKALEG